MEPKHNNTPSSSSWFDEVKNSLTYLGGLFAIFFPLTWYMGRQYLSGYYAALNINISTVSISTPEYIYGGWIFTLSMTYVSLLYLLLANYTLLSITRIRSPFYLRLSNFALILILSVLYYTFNEYIPLDEETRNWIEIIIISTLFVSALFITTIPPLLSSLQATLQRNSRLRRRTNAFFSELNQATNHKDNKYLVVLISIFAILPFFFYMSTQAYNSGFTGAKRFTQAADCHTTTIITSNIIDSDLPRSTISTTPTNSITYRYEGLHLLEFDEDRYFLYAKLDANLAPSKIYVIKSDTIYNIQIGMRDVNKTWCSQDRSTTLN